GIHARSEVRAGPFVPLNCAAVPESLLESELFGHRKGAFTGADRDRSGRFREAHGGTLFLDEIGDMPAAAQAKLLRVLQEQTIEPLGGGEAVKVDVRMVAATHKDLALLCRQGKFREDLYYRLRVVEVTVPPLRERGQDVLLLARAFLDRVGKPGIELTSAVESKLLAHTWPGNVRELKNAMERAAIFCSGNQVQVEDLPAELRSDSSPLPSAHGSITSAEPSTRPERDSSEDHVTEPSFTAARERVVEQFETRYFTDLLRLHRGNVSRVAREAGLHRQSLQKMLRRLEIEPQSYRSPST
ncbi:MAG: sigma-54 dependent transcriptional regulator, partial [Thermoanaerobaculia bacterium]|nr:sigma-54 dependent transcriptional regulator [Thermoanaerobaculia bacterium]